MRLKYAYLSIMRNKLRSFLTAWGVAVAIASIVTLSALSDAIYHQVSHYVYNPYMSSDAVIAFPILEHRASSLNFSIDGVLDHYELNVLIGELDGEQVPYVLIYRNGHESMDWLGVEIRGKVEGNAVYFNPAFEDFATSSRFVQINHSELKVPFLDRKESMIGCFFMRPNGELMFRGMSSILELEVENPGEIAFSNESGYRLAGTFTVGENAQGLSKIPNIEKMPFLVVTDEDFLPNTVLMRVEEDKLSEAKTEFIMRYPDFRLVSFYEQYYDLIERVNVLYQILAVMSAIIIFLAVLGMSVTLLMMINERKKDIVLMKVFGFSDFSIIRLFFPETMALCVVGFLIGCVLSVFLVGVANQNMKLFHELFNIRIVITLPVLLRALAYSLLMGVAASFVPYFKLKKVEAGLALKE